VSTDERTDALPDPRATRLLKVAHERLYRWPEGFAGFRAGVSVIADGAEVRGDVDVLAGHGAAFTPDRDHRVNPQVAAEVVELATRLAPRAFATLDGRFGGTFRRDLDRRGIRAVAVVGDPRGTVRWIEGDRLVETRFAHADGQRRLRVLEVHETGDGRWLPATVVEELELGGASTGREVTEAWTSLDGVVVPTCRTVRTTSGGDRHSLEIRLADHVASR
jgi:hypothetical protein